MSMTDISSDLWEPLKKEERYCEGVVQSNVIFHNNRWYKFKKNKLALISLIVILIILLFAVIGPYLSQYTYSEQDLTNANQGPSFKHWFGTDSLGRDLFIRVAYGARISLFVGMAATLVNIAVGVFYGGISGYIGGTTDHIMMRIVDIIDTIPLVLYAIIFMVLLEPGLVSIIIALSMVYWVRMARIVRGQVLNLKEQEFIIAAKTLGAGFSRILLRHLIPNTIGLIIVTITMMIPEAIFIESFLSFIGLGVSSPMASWGSLVANSIGGIRSYPYQLFFPSIAICITILAFNLLGDGLRDAFDARTRK